MSTPRETDDLLGHMQTPLGCSLRDAYRHLQAAQKSVKAATNQTADTQMIHTLYAAFSAIHEAASQMMVFALVADSLTAHGIRAPGAVPAGPECAEERRSPMNGTTATSGT